MQRRMSYSDTELLPELSQSPSGRSITLSQGSGVLEEAVEGGLLVQIQETVKRWAAVAFEQPRQRDDPEMIQHALQKCCSGLMQAIAQLRLPDDSVAELFQVHLPGPSASLVQWQQGDEVAEAPTRDDESQAAEDMQGEEDGEAQAAAEASFDDLRQYVVDCAALPRFSQISSCDAAKKTLTECVIFPSKYPNLFTGVRQPWKGILLYGPPGTGKTELAKAVAGECGAAFILLTPSALLSKFMGESEKLVSRVFAFAKHIAQENCASIIFIDEVDALAVSRADEGSDQSLRRLLAEILLQFNALQSSHRVIVLAATNRIGDIDPALLRRFERRIEIGLLDEEDRAGLLSLKMEGTEMDSGVDLEGVAKATGGYSGADLELLCREAAMEGVRELLESSREDSLASDATARPVTQGDFVAALTVIKPSASASAVASRVGTPESDGKKKRKAANGDVVAVKEEK